MEKHINVVAALHIGMAFLGIILGITVMVVFSLIGNLVDDQKANLILHLIGKIGAIFLFLLSIPGLIAGIGLFRRKEWARILTLIVSVLNLLNFPFGTAAGVYSFWVLVQEETVALFKKSEEKGRMI